MLDELELFLRDKRALYFDALLISFIMVTGFLKYAIKQEPWWAALWGVASAAWIYTTVERRTRYKLVKDVKNALEKIRDDT